MKIAVVILLIGNVTLCQSQAIDSCILKCKYSFTFQPDSLNPEKKGNDLMVLEIGKVSSLFYSQFRKIGDSLIEQDEKQGKDYRQQGGANSAKYYLNKWSLILAKNFPPGQNTASETILQPYKYVEPYTVQDWLLTNDTATVSGLFCYKATTTFRGRNFEAWFTKTIAIPNGPWKFSGLPGLIVKVYDSKNQFTFELIEVEKPKENRPIFFPEKKYIATNRKELWQLKKQNADDPIGFLENYSGYHLKLTTPMTMEERKAKSKPYNPLELE